MRAPIQYVPDFRPTPPRKPVPACLPGLALASFAALALVLPAGLAIAGPPPATGAPPAAATAAPDDSVAAGPVAATTAPGDRFADQGGAGGAPITFVDHTEAAGIRFRHHHGGTGEKHLPETMGSGVAWLDYDLDGRWDLYLVDSGPIPGQEATEAAPDEPAEPEGDGFQPPGHNVLYRAMDGTGAADTSDGAGPTDGHAATGETDSARRAAGPTYRRVPQAGVEDARFGVGASVADHDNDGFSDLYVTNWGPNELYRNNGDGTFSPVGAAAGVAHERLSASSSWGDLDLDGFLDLYVATYVDYDPETAPYCGDRERDIRDYCHPRLFDGQADLLFDNRGDGTFADVSARAGIENPLDGKGLGVVMGDVDDDGLLDIYVANDTTPNFLYLNRGELRFEDAGAIMGVAFGENGEAQAGMGVDMGDVDGDGRLDLVVTNFAFEPYNLYRLYGGVAFLDDSYALGLGDATYGYLGFGVAMTDLDSDADLDLAIANGHILDNVTQFEHHTTYPQPNQVIENRLTELRRRALERGEVAAGTDGDWRPTNALFADVSAAAGEAITRMRVSRGLAVADGDGDGRPDLAIANSRQPADLLLNTTRNEARRLVLRLRGRGSNRDAVGTRLRVRPLARADDGTLRPMQPGFAQTFETKSASSYCSQNASDLYVGLGAADGARVEIRWPDGNVERLDAVDAGSLALVVQGRGLVTSTQLR